MLVSFISWIAAGLIVGFAATKIVNLRGDDPNLGIGLSAAVAFFGGLFYCLISGTAVSGFNIWSVLVAFAAAIIAATIWHVLRTRTPYAAPTSRRSYREPAVLSLRSARWTGCGGHKDRLCSYLLPRRRSTVDSADRRPSQGKRTIVPACAACLPRLSCPARNTLRERESIHMTDNPSVPDNGPENVSEKSASAHAEPGPAFATAEPRVSDLSEEIVRAVRKSAGERVTCRRIVGDKYRCNWWSAMDTKGYDNPNMAGQLVTTHRVARSELLHVTKTQAGLVIRAVSGDPR